MIGDFDGDGTNTPSVYRPANSKFYLDANGNGVWDSIGTNNDVVHQFKPELETPLSCYWIAGGKDEIGTRSDALYFPEFNGNGSWDRLAGGDMVHNIGGFLSDTPVIGKWAPAAPLLATLRVRQAFESDSDTCVEPLTGERLAPIVEPAIDIWSTASLSAGHRSRLAQLRAYVADLPGVVLGQAVGAAITIDGDAAAQGRCVENDGRRRTAGESAPKNVQLFDLLTAVMHEMGHVLGYDNSEGGVMDESLPPGTRRVWEHEPSFDEGTNIGSKLRTSGLGPNVADEYFATT